MSKFRIEMKKIITNVVESTKFMLSIIFPIMLCSFVSIGLLLGEHCIIPLAKKGYGIILLLLFTIFLFSTIFFTSGWLNIICFILFISWFFLCFAFVIFYSLGAINEVNMTGEELECNNDMTETYNQINQ